MMKTLKKCTLIIIFFILSISLAYSQQTGMTFTQISGLNKLVFKGSNTSNTIYLPIPSQWNVMQIHLFLNFSNAIATGNASKLYLYIDDVPFSSLELTSENKNKATWSVVIPQEKIKAPLINLKITNTLYESGYDCTKMTNPDNWVIMSGDSYIFYEYSVNAFNPDLKNFPYPFINQQGLEKDITSLYISNKENNDMLLAALNVSNALGHYKTWRGLDIALQENEISTSKINLNTIWIGTAKNLKLNNSDLKIPFIIDQDVIRHQDGTAFADNEGIIFLTQLPNDPTKALLIITGNSEQGVLNASEKLRDPNLKNSITFPEYIEIKKPTAIELKHSLLTEPMTFEKLGFDNQIAKGIGENTLNYPINLANPKQINSISLKIKYSASSVLGKNSSLSLKVNDTPLASIPLYQLKNQLNTWNVNVDQELLKPGINHFDFTFTLHIPDEKCSPEEMNLAWGTIHKNTELNVKFNDKTALYYLQNLKSYIIGNLVINIPKKTLNTLEQYEYLINLIKDLNYVNQMSLMANDYLTNNNNENIIYIGKYTNQFDKLPFNFENDKLLIDPKLPSTFTMNDETPISVIELIPSPFNHEKTLLYISGLDQDALTLAMKTLNQIKRLNLVNGNILLLYKNKSFTSFQSQKMYEENEKSTNKIKYTAYLSWIFILILVLSIIIYFYIKINRRDKHND